LSKEKQKKCSNADRRFNKLLRQFNSESAQIQKERKEAMGRKKGK